MKRTALIEFRKSKKLTQLEMAEKIGVSFQTYRFIEIGYRNPSLKVLKQFRKAFPKANIDKFFLD